MKKVRENTKCANNVLFTISLGGPFIWTHPVNKIISLFYYLFDREHMPGLFRKRVNLDTYELPTAPPPLGTGEDTISSLSESEEEMEADSVIQNMKDRRKASGQEIADIKLRQGYICVSRLVLIE